MTLDGWQRKNLECTQDVQYVQQGWQCPICGRVYSPWTKMCDYCGGNMMGVVTSSGTLTAGITNTVGETIRVLDKGEQRKN